MNTITVRKAVRLPGTNIILESGDTVQIKERSLGHIATDILGIDTQTRLSKDLIGMLMKDKTMAKKYVMMYKRFPDVAAHEVMDYISLHFRQASDEIQDFANGGSEYNEKEMDEIWEEVYIALSDN
jgi:hypothetical protein